MPSTPESAAQRHAAGPSTRAHCAIVPSYVLEAMRATGDPTLVAHADATLALDALFRLGVRTAEARPGPTPRPAAERVAPGTSAGPVRVVHDARQGTTLPGVVVRSEGDPPTGDRAVTEAYDGLGSTWELWQSAYGRTSLDGKGLPLLASVHFSRTYDNAFWDGTQMVFGDGDGVVFLPFTRSLDVIGHELAHGVTQYTAGLNYQGQSGALNESVSDVFGVLVKQRALGQDAASADWLIGAELLAPGVKGVALRSMAAPGTAYDDPRLGTDPQPAHVDHYVHTTDDNGGVHINSGIPNKAFHVLATTLGGPAWEVAGQIWFDTLTGEIKADCDFTTFAGLTVAAASARFGADGAQVAAVRAGWDAVGVPYAVGPAGQALAPSTGEAGDASVDPGRDDPSGGESAPTSETQVSVRRTGGFAGLRRERTVALAELPERDARAWRGLLAQDRLQVLALENDSGAAHPDTFCFGVRCDSPRLDVEIREPNLSEDVRSLFERTLGLERPKA
ncbi:MAG: protealysin inhibitor emfourin [Ornithinibacter sp.]